MSSRQTDIRDISVRLAKTQGEVQAAQRMRYKVFYEEFAATPNTKVAATRLDVDDYDEYADHLIVVDSADGREEIVGTYRLLRQESADRYGQFYSSDEYDLTPLISSGANLLELGRSCVLPEYRTRPVMQLLWQGIADFITDHDIELLFGCASIPSTDIKSVSRPLSYLHHYHLAPEELRPRAIKGRYINLDIVPKEDLNPKEVFNELPPLIKGYLRVGATIGEGAVIDHQFNTTDICVLMQTHMVTKRYRRHYERKIQRTLPGGEKE